MSSLKTIFLPWEERSGILPSAGESTTSPAPALSPSRLLGSWSSVRVLQRRCSPVPSIQIYMAWTFSPCGNFMYMCLMALLRWELAEVAMAAVLMRGFLQGGIRNNPSCEPFLHSHIFQPPRPGRSMRQLGHKAGCHLQWFHVILQGEHRAAQADTGSQEGPIPGAKRLQRVPLIPKLLLVNQCNRLPKGFLTPCELFISTFRSGARLMQGNLSWGFLNKSASSRRAFLPQLPSQPG